MELAWVKKKSLALASWCATRGEIRKIGEVFFGGDSVLG